MAGFEGSVISAFGATLLVSAAAGFLRREEEFARRAGLKGTKLLPDGSGGNIEYAFTGPGPARQGPTIVLESGLGAPLESWDWIDHLLPDHLNVIRYNRAGYARSTTKLHPERIMERLVGELAPEGRLFLVGHSLGALVLCETLRQAPTITERTNAVFLIDGTDERLLDQDRSSSRRRGMFRQMVAQEIVGDLTGVNRWVQSRMERDVEYRPDVQRSFVVTSSSTRTQLTAMREYFHSPTGSQAWLRAQSVPIHTIAASDNLTQQKDFAEYLGATYDVVPDSSHRSIIGKLANAEKVVTGILAGVNGAH